MKHQACNLFLTGHGYLKEIIECNNRFSVRFYCLPTIKHSTTEEETLWIDCDLSDYELIRQIKKYRCALQTGHTVLVKFSMKYIETCYFQYCTIAPDQDHIVTMQANLLTIDEVYIDGAQVYPEKKLAVSQSLVNNTEKTARSEHVQGDLLLEPQVSDQSIPAQNDSLSTNDQENNDDAELFGALWPLSERVQLDSSVGRNVFRKQVDRLKALGFRFESETQIWSKPEASS
jgi:hypothetical protein